MRAEYLSINGNNHTNEDRLLVQEIDAHSIIAVLADGMGGLSLGDVAADVVTQSIAKFIAENYKWNTEQEILHKALEYADGELRHVSIEKKSNMGAAVAVAIVKERHLYCTWQGNVRIYVRHEGNMSLLTKDHIANIGYGRTALTRCIKGAGLRDDIPYLCYQLITGDKVFICTDGLYGSAENDMEKMSIDEIKEKMDIFEDDASIIQITVE